MARDLFKELEAADGTFAKKWEPKTGEILVGKVKSLSMATSDYGLSIVCVVAREPDGTEVTVYGGQVSLQSEFNRHRPQVGEKIGIKYFGKVGNSNRYTMIVDREGGTGGVDWKEVAQDLADKRDRGKAAQQGAIATQMAASNEPAPAKDLPF